MIFEVFLSMISWEEKSNVLLHPDIFFVDLGDQRMKFSNEESKIGLEEQDSSEVYSFAERELKSFFYLFSKIVNEEFWRWRQC